jgi:cyclin A
MVSDTTRYTSEPTLITLPVSYPKAFFAKNPQTRLRTKIVLSIKPQTVISEKEDQPQLCFRRQPSDNEAARLKKKRIQKQLPKAPVRGIKDLKIITIEPGMVLECDESTFEHMPSPTEPNRRSSVFFAQKNNSDMEKTTALETLAGSKLDRTEANRAAPEDDDRTRAESSRPSTHALSHRSSFPETYLDTILSLFLNNRFSTGQLKKDAFNAAQTQINEKMRAVLINWLLSVQSKTKMKPQTFFIAVQLLDGYCTRKSIDRKDFQKLGITCLFVAAKFEEIFPPKLSEIVKLCDGLYSAQEIVLMEADILNTADFLISSDTVFALMEIIAFKAQVPPQIVKICTALLFSSLFDLRTIEFGPDRLSRSCLFLATKIFQQHSASNAAAEGLRDYDMDLESAGRGEREESLLGAIMAGEFDFKCVKFVTYLVKNLEKAGMFAIRKLFPRFTN